MGDVGDVFREMTKYKKAKRADNTTKSTQLLEDRGILFESKNDGAHLIVASRGYPSLVADFWPSTGKWIVRENGGKGRGVFPLLKKLGYTDNS